MLYNNVRSFSLGLIDLLLEAISLQKQPPQKDRKLYLIRLNPSLTTRRRGIPQRLSDCGTEGTRVTLRLDYSLTTGLLDYL